MTDASKLLPLIQSTLDDTAFWARTAPTGTTALVTWALGGEDRRILPIERLSEATANLRRPLRVAICGDNKAGKSTLINFLLGEQVAATSFFECTFCPMVLAYGATRAARIVFTNDTRTIVTPEELPALLEQMLAAERTAEVLRVEVELPLQALRRFELADVPGVGASERNAQVAQSFSQKADAILYVLNATLLGQADLLADVRGLAQEFEALAILVNKLDQIGLENAERAVQYVAQQDYGRTLPVFPLAMGLVERPGAEGDQARTWLQAIERTWLDGVAADTARVKATAALARCQRELAALTTCLQAAYLQGVRVHGVVASAFRTLTPARDAMLRRIKNRIQRWLRDEAFMPSVTALYDSLRERPAESQAELKDRLNQAFGSEQMQAQAGQLLQAIQRAAEDEWRGIVAQFERTSGLTYSPFQLEKAAAFLQRETEMPAIASPLADAPAPGGDEALPFKELKVRDLETAGRWGGLFGAVVEAMAAVGTAVAGIGGVLTGLGLPAAALGAAAVLLWTHQRRKRGAVDSSPAEFAEMVNELRQESAKAVLKHLYPDGLDTMLGSRLDELMEACRNELRQNLWSETDRYAGTLERLHAYLAEGDRHQEAIRGLRRQVGSTLVEGVSGPLSAPAARAALLYGKPIPYGPEDRERLRKDLATILALEDAEVAVVDRGLTGNELDWLAAAPPATTLRLLVYEVERDATDRAAFLRALRSLRGRRSGLVAVRAVKVAGHDRTPLERTLLCGNDWVLEINGSLSQAGRRSLSVVMRTAQEREFIQQEILDRYWSATVLAADPTTSEIHLLDL